MCNEKLTAFTDKCACDIPKKVILNANGKTIGKILSGYKLLRRIDSDLSMELSPDFPFCEKMVVSEFLKILKLDTFHPFGSMLLKRNHGAEEVWLEWDKCMVNVSSCKNGQELYEEVRNLVLMCNITKSAVEQAKKQAEAQKDQPIKTCSLRVYKGQSRERKCGKACYKYGKCYRHYHRDNFYEIGN